MTIKPANTPKESQNATQRLSQAAMGGRQDVAEGVRTAVGSGSQTVTVTGITPGVQIRCVGVPVADWLCACGRHERARGRAVGICPHATTVGGRAVS